MTGSLYWDIRAIKDLWCVTCLPIELMEFRSYSILFLSHPYYLEKVIPGPGNHFWVISRKGRSANRCPLYTVAPVMPVLAPAMPVLGLPMGTQSPGNMVEAWDTGSHWVVWKRSGGYKHQISALCSLRLACQIYTCSWRLQPLWVCIKPFVTYILLHPYLKCNLLLSNTPA